MKPQRIIITRDSAMGEPGHVTLWSTRLLVLNGGGGWYTPMEHDPDEAEVIHPDRFKALFRFLPRKGTKTVYGLKGIKP